ncbi:MAG TPA: GTPase [Gemmataceae bacterium]|nr:GTPase [Gemmataceae bacterium]
MDFHALFRKAFGQKGGNPVETIIAELQKRRQELENASVRIGFIGEAGVGKSSLINAMLGRPVALIGATTIAHNPEGEKYQYEGVTFVDLPGTGVPERPFKSYVDDLKLLERGRYDAFVMVSSHRLRENEVTLFDVLHKKGGKPFFVVRSHFDAAVQAESDEATARRKIEETFRKHLDDPRLHVYMVASPTPRQYDLPILLQDLVSSLPDDKRVRLLAAVPAYTHELLKKKREAAESIVYVYAGLAAANGLNPIPGTDILLDLGLMQKMTRQVVGEFGLQREQLENLARAQMGTVKLDFMLDAARTVLARLVEGGVAAFFKETSTETVKQVSKKSGKSAVRYGAKYAPIIGQLVSAGIGFGTAYYYGQFLLDDCEKALVKIVDQIERKLIAHSSS